MSGARRIGVDFHVFDGIFQGSRTHLLELFSAAIALAPQFQFIFFLNEVERLRDGWVAFRQPNVQLIKIASRHGISRLLFQLSWLQAKHKIDLLHVQYRTPIFQFGPVACTIHDVLFESHPRFFSRSFAAQSHLTFRRSAKRADLLFTVSEFSRREISSRYKVTLEKLHLIYNGVDRTRFFPGDHGKEVLANYGIKSRNYLLTVSRIEPRKNHRNLLLAYSLLDRRDLPLVVIGQMDAGAEDVVGLAQSLGIAERVVFLTKVQDGELPVFIRNASAFIYPAFAEGFGMPVAEAMASGVPVVTSNTTALPEVVGDAGILVDPDDPAAIAKGISEVLDHPELAKKLVDLGLRRATQFNWHDSATTLVKAYENYFRSEGVGC